MTEREHRTTPLGDLGAAVEAAAAKLRADAGVAEAPRSAPNLERPPKAEFGDYSTNAPMLLAPVLGDQPRAIAERLGEAVAGELGGALEKWEVAGPGFLNLFLAEPWYRDCLGAVLAAGDRFGAAVTRPGETPDRVLIEFVSANPTGPLTAAGGRHAAYGDALARILEFTGSEVGREYYVNDHGSQVRRLGESIRARARGDDVPDGGYEGDYVAELATLVPGAAEADPDALATAGVEELVGRIRDTLHRFRVDFDVWFRESTVHEGSPSAVDTAMERLGEAGHVYESEGATWVRTTDFGDDKDRVAKRSSGEETYFGADVAYHQDKRARGFSRAINVWGADHHGYMARTHAAWQALGGEKDSLELIIMQFVNVIERGERASMSKRRGDFVTLDDLVDQIGVDAARFFMLQRSHDTTVDLDLDLAREQSSENPVYYVQYAHARIASVLAKAGEERVATALASVGGDGGLGDLGPDSSLDPSERALVKKLLAWPGEVQDAAERRAPHRVATYALEVAQEFTAFYRDCQVVGVQPEELESFRIALSVASKRTIASALELLGVEAPESM